MLCLICRDIYFHFQLEGFYDQKLNTTHKNNNVKCTSITLEEFKCSIYSTSLAASRKKRNIINTTFDYLFEYLNAYLLMNVRARAEAVSQSSGMNVTISLVNGIDSNANTLQLKVDDVVVFILHPVSSTTSIYTTMDSNTTTTNSPSTTSFRYYLSNASLCFLNN